MFSRDEIFNKVQKTLVEMFGFAPETINLNTHLIDELDFDSIDALNLASKLDEVLDKKINPLQLKEIRTVNDVVNVLERLLQEEE